MSAIYILWLRELKRYTRSQGADRGLAGPTAALPAGAGVWTGPGFQARGQWKLFAVCCAGRDWHVGSVSRRFFPVSGCCGTGSLVF